MCSEQSIIDYQRIENAIAYIYEHNREQPGLDEVAAHVHLSPFHFQRLFTRWAGISPKKFLKYLTLQYARTRLEENPGLAEIAQDAGLSGTGRLHDLFITMEGMTPDEYRRSGAGQSIYYGTHYSPFGRYLLAITGENMICSLQFFEDESTAAEELRNHWIASNLIHDQEKTSLVASSLFPACR